MLSAELELTDLDARHWRNGWRLLVPPRVLAWPSWALVIVDGAPERVLSVITPPRRVFGVGDKVVLRFSFESAVAVPPAPK